MADVEIPPPAPATPLEVPSASTIPVSATEPATVTKSDADVDVSINEGEETPEARALSQGQCHFISSFLLAYRREITARTVEFYFADANLPYDK